MPSRAGSVTSSIRTRRQPSRGTAGFDFTLHIHDVCADMVSRLPELSHIDIERVAISFSQARKRVAHGLYATTTPMRFEDGALIGVRRSRKYSVQRLFDDQQREMLYIVSFYLPRFMDVCFKEKLITIIHELWHISPDFNGDLRRHSGRCYVHTRSQKEYDAQMAQFADRWLDSNPSPKRFEFLHLSFDELTSKHGKVYGIKIPHPKLLPVE